MNPINAWWLAIRPKTLSLAASPVLAGNALAWADFHALNGITAGASLLASITIQIGANLYNDAADHERGVDGADRLGPPRATAQGWLSGAQVKRGAFVSFALAFLLGVYLASIGGWPIVLLGLSALLAAYAYTGGPKPIAYSASGELFVFLYFGVFAVTGSYYLQTNAYSSAALATGAALGLLAAAVLTVNNYRDLDSDRRVGKFTLCHQLGRAGSQMFYAALLLLPFALPGFVAETYVASWWVLAALPVALFLVWRFYVTPPGRDFNRLLAATAQLQLAFAVLIGIAYLL
jgi:1,4-dihydroxy-2-naphthoate octaprenyltransferase